MIMYHILPCVAPTPALYVLAGSVMFTACVAGDQVCLSMMYRNSLLGIGRSWATHRNVGRAATLRRLYNRVLRASALTPDSSSTDYVQQKHVSDGINSTAS
jgi:hypothetical protein